MDNTESQESKTNKKIEARVALVKADLAKQVPWNVIAKKYHVSPKTISKINKGESLSSNNVNSLSIKSDSSEWGSIAFRSFESGKGPIQTVIESNIPPDAIKQLHSQWMDMKKIELSIPNLPSVLDLNTRLEKIEDERTGWDVLVGMYFGEQFGEARPCCPKCLEVLDSEGIDFHCPTCGFKCDLDLTRLLD
jgi:hypothetical protein